MASVDSMAVMALMAELRMPAVSQVASLFATLTAPLLATLTASVLAAIVAAFSATLLGASFSVATFSLAPLAAAADSSRQARQAVSPGMIVIVTALAATAAV